MFGEIIGAISNFMYSYLLIIMLIGVGLYYTLRTRLVQVRMFKETIRVILEKPVESGAVSSFQALMVSTASRVGTGNIIGISTAVCLGGYGAVFWMWVIAFIESTLAQIYKKRGPHGSYGGPAYYIEAALGSRGLAVLFALALIVTYGCGFNMLCSYNLQSTFAALSFYNSDTTPWIIGAVEAVLPAGRWQARYQSNLYSGSFDGRYLHFCSIYPYYYAYQSGSRRCRQNFC